MRASRSRRCTPRMCWCSAPARPAACIAARLSEDAGTQVALIEAGPAAWRDPWIRIPAGLRPALRQRQVRLALPYRSRAGARRPQHPLAARQGGGRLGRGERAGLPARQPARLRPLGAVRRARLGAMTTCCPSSSGWRPGPASASERARHRRADPCRRGAAYLAWRGRPSSRPALAMGHQRVKDFNGAWHEGAGPMQMNVKGGVRSHSGDMFLKPARGRANLRIMPERAIQRLIFEGTRCTGAIVPRPGRPGDAGRRGARWCCRPAPSARRRS